jgi:hypothetical protein
MMSKWLRLFSISTLAYLAQVFGVDASMGCKRIEELPTVSDERTLGLLNAYGETRGGSKPLLMRPFDDRFFIAFPAGQDCKSSGCYYRLLDLKDGEIRERFSFQGTGVILFFYSSTVHIEHFQDRFFTIALETSPQTHIVVQLPFRSNTVLVSVRAPQQIRMPTC